MEEQAPFRCGGVDVLREYPKVDVPGLHVLNGLDGLPQGTHQPRELPDDQGIAAAEIRERGLQLRPVSPCAGGLFDEEPATPRAAQGLELEGRVLVKGRNPGIADRPAGLRKGSQNGPRRQLSEHFHGNKEKEPYIGDIYGNAFPKPWFRERP